MLRAPCGHTFDKTAAAPRSRWLPRESFSRRCSGSRRNLVREETRSFSVPSFDSSPDRDRARLAHGLDAERHDQPPVTDEHRRPPGELEDLLLGVMIA